MSQQKSRRVGSLVVFGIISCVLIAAIVLSLYYGDKYQTIITRSLGHKSSKIVSIEGADAEDTEYFKSNFKSTTDLIEYEKKLSQRIVGEGAVLLKNDGLLPLKGSEKISLLSESSVDIVSGGGGSGEIDTSKIKNLRQVLEAKGFSVNPVLWDFYEKSEYGRTEGNFWQGELGTINECPINEYSDEAIKSMSDYNDAAIIVISRKGQEGADLFLKTDEYDGTNLQLSDREIELIEMANNKFNKVVVLLNTANPVELGWIEKYNNIKACLWIGFTGQEGLPAVADIIDGTINPSGKLVDTYAYNTLKSPAMENFGIGMLTNGTHPLPYKQQYVVYQEGIYIGYKYYETRYEDYVMKKGNAKSMAGSSTESEWEYTKEVQYPFGHGLSYTDFVYSNYSVSEKGDSFKVTLDVKNVGKVDGKEIVEVYLQMSYTEYDKENGIEKSAVELAGFSKTKLLAPGESQKISVTILKEQLRTFDSKGANGYILEEGNYYFTASNNSHSAINNILAAKGFSVSDGMDSYGDKSLVFKYFVGKTDTDIFRFDSKTGNEISNQFDFAGMDKYDKNFKYLSRSDWERTWPSFFGTLTDGMYKFKAPAEFLKISQNNLFKENPEAVMPITESGDEINLITLKDADYNDPVWDTLLNSLSAKEMLDLVRNGGWQTSEIPSIGKPRSNDQDGPAGITSRLIQGATSCTGYPVQSVLASTWNENLATEMGTAVGEDGLYSKVHGWYAPGANLHRTPYGGRNFEYYSEDAFLSGYMAQYEIKAVQDMGMYVYLKHFALNDSETSRYGINTMANEQTIREVYLKPFEMAVKNADCSGIMSAYDSIGGIWCGANKSLLTNVLRDEWGFKGIVITDYASYLSVYMNLDAGIIAGNDLWLNSDSNLYQDTNLKSPTIITGLRNATHNILYTVVNSAAMNGISKSAKVVKITPLWKYWLAGIEVLLFGLLVILLIKIRKTLKKTK